MDQGDMDFNVFLDREGGKKDDTQLLTKEELTEAIDLLKSENVEKYEILKINDTALEKFAVYKKL